MRAQWPIRRVLGTATVVALLLGGLLLPAAGFASPLLPLTVGASTPGTLTPTSVANTYAADYSVRLKAGQTFVATYTPSSAVTQPAMAMWAPFATDVGTLFRNADRHDPKSSTAIFLLAPKTATYRLRVSGQSTAGTFTIDSAIVPALRYSLSPMGAPTHATRNSWFKVTTTLVGTFDQLANPVRFVVQRKVGRWWRDYRTVKPLFDRQAVYLGADVPFRASLRLSKGTYRVRAVFADAAHPRPQRNAWRTITVSGVDLTRLPGSMSPRAALRAYLQAVLDKRYADAYALLPRDKQRAYGSAEDYGQQVQAYGITSYKMGPSRQKGSQVTIVCEQDTPQMPINYTWTYVRVDGAWYVKSRVMGGTL